MKLIPTSFKRNGFFIALFAVVLALLLLSTFGRKPPRTPDDEAHRPFLEALGRGESRAEVERKCPACHNPRGLPLPTAHPPKEQCLICHPPAG